MKLVVEVKAISKSYGDVQALSDLSLALEPARIHGFIGENGAGKSTLLRCLANQIFPDKGSAKIFGLDCIQEAKKLKGKIAYLASEINYPEKLKAQDLFELSLKLEGASQERLSFLLDYFKLDSQKEVSTLSLGNKKKVAMILIFLKEAELYLLDEPTSGLDPVMQEKFFKLLLEAKAQGKTIFLSSHNLADIERYCDRILMIKDGRLSQDLDLKDRAKEAVYQLDYLLASGQRVKDNYQGDINVLLKKLAGLELQDLEIKKTSLDLKRLYDED